MFKNLRHVFVGSLLALGLVATVAFAQVYYGWNPTTGLETYHGIPVAGGVIPSLTGSTCGTTSTVGGAGTFQVTAGATACTLVITLPASAPNGVYCLAIDETTPADTMKQSAHTANSCTVTGTVVAADKVLVEINGF